jgi:hypothetical protein
MLATASHTPGATRNFPRSVPGTGPTSRADASRHAELLARIAALEREQRLQFERIAQIQQQLDDIHRTLKKLSK